MRGMFLKMTVFIIVILYDISSLNTQMLGWVNIPNEIAPPPPVTLLVCYIMVLVVSMFVTLVPLSGIL